MTTPSAAAVHSGPEKPILKHVSWSPFGGIHDEKASMWFVVVMMSVGVAAG